MTDFFLQNYLHKTNARTPQETKSSQMIADLLLARSKQTDCIKEIEHIYQGESYQMCNLAFLQFTKKSQTISQATTTNFKK